MPRKKKTEEVEENSEPEETKEEKKESTEDKEIEKELEKEFKGKKKEKSELIVPLEDYVKSSIHLGTKVITPKMREYVYKRRADGLAILNTNMINEKLLVAASFLTSYKQEEIIVVCKREAGWKAAKLFSKLTGIRVFTKKYPAGIITNISLKEFFEPSLVMICDPWLDKNALHDAVILGIPIIGLCDTNNLTDDIDFVIPSNNKSDKSLGLIFYILAKEYCKKHKILFESKIEDFVEEK